MSNRLTSQQYRFCVNYAFHGNATKAYLDAGFTAASEGAAREAASNLLTKSDIKMQIENCRESAKSEYKINVDALIAQLVAIAQTDVSDVFDEDGYLKPLPEIPHQALAAITELETVTNTDRRGNTTSRTKGKLADRQKAVNTLLQIAGYTSDLNSSLRTLESYGIKLRQYPDGEWKIEK